MRRGRRKERKKNKWSQQCAGSCWHRMAVNAILWRFSSTSFLLIFFFAFDTPQSFRAEEGRGSLKDSSWWARDLTKTASAIDWWQHIRGRTERTASLVKARESHVKASRRYSYSHVLRLTVKQWVRTTRRWKPNKTCDACGAPCSSIVSVRDSHVHIPSSIPETANFFHSSDLFRLPNQVYNMSTWWACCGCALAWG